MIRFVCDPVVWAAAILPLLAVGEWSSAVRSGYVGPALFLAGCVMALPVGVRLALTPAWLSDAAVIVAGVMLAVLIHSKTGEWTHTATASQAGSVALIIPTFLMLAAAFVGSVACLLFNVFGVLSGVRAALAPLGHLHWRAGFSAIVAVAALMALR